MLESSSSPSANLVVSNFLSSDVTGQRSRRSAGLSQRSCGLPRLRPPPPTFGRGPGGYFDCAVRKGAGREIETVFAKGTIKLAKPLEHLSKSFINRPICYGDAPVFDCGTIWRMEEMLRAGLPPERLRVG